MESRINDRTSYIRYHDGIEVIASDEAETIQKIIESMQRVADRTFKQLGEHVRVSHAKSHGLAVGELRIMENLPERLRQGLFAQAATYPVIVRLANVPGTIESDRIHTQRGLALKILGVQGPMIAEHDESGTQDFVLGDGNRFQAPNMKAFLMLNRGLEQTTHMAEGFKATFSDLAQAANSALHAVGMDSANLDLLGHARIHPLAEAYFSQAPIRYGDYVAKLAVVPVSSAQQALADSQTNTNADENALRTATVDYLRANDAEFDVRIQLCTDLKTMPVEDAGKEWSEEESPYQTVAKLFISRQEAYSEARRAYVDGLSFAPAHSLAAHRPLGSIMRARLKVYPEMSRRRRKAEGGIMSEPTSISDVPA